MDRETGLPDPSERNRELSVQIASLEKPVTKILKEIRPNLERGAYAVIVGDDVSGRVPAKLVYGVVASLSRERNLALPKAKFFTSASGLDFAARQKRAEEILSHLTDVLGAVNQDSRALIVTERITSAESLEALFIALQKMNLPIDLAALHVSTNRFVRGVYLKYGVTVIDGNSKTAANAVKDRIDLSGVQRSPVDPNQLLAVENLSSASKAAESELNILAQKIKAAVFVK